MASSDIAAGGRNPPRFRAAPPVAVDPSADFAGRAPVRRRASRDAERVRRPGPAFFAVVAPPDGGYVLIEDLGPDLAIHFAMAFHRARAGDPIPEAAGWGPFATSEAAAQAAREVFGDRLGELLACPTDVQDCGETARRHWIGAIRRRDTGNWAESEEETARWSTAGLRETNAGEWPRRSVEDQ